MRNTKKRFNEVADLLRTGQGTPELEVEYERLAALQPRGQVVKYGSVYDLPIARQMWEADMREVER